MRTGSACEHCRKAKVKCDLQRPICGRCLSRGTPCFGYVEGADFLFRDGTEIARQSTLRKKAPRLSARDKALIMSFRLEHNLAPKLPMSVDDLETQMIERFFMNWVLHPDLCNSSAGHLPGLPELYHNTSPGHVLRLAIEAVAYAELFSRFDGEPSFRVKARSKYGAALENLRLLISNEDIARDDSVLAALLMIDNFELVYLSRREPLGRHRDGFLYLLRLKGGPRLLSPRSFALWRVAHSRLQAHQLLSRQGPVAEQQEWMDCLSAELPDLEMAVNVLDINRISARADAIVSDRGACGPSDADDLRRTVLSIYEVLEHIESWKKSLPPSWVPSRTPSPAVKERISGPAAELHEVWPSNVQLYPDIWLSYARNYHNAAEIVLRESLLDLEDSRLPDRDQQAKTSQKEAIQELAQSVIESVPMTLGFVDKRGCPLATFLGGDKGNQELERQAVGDFFVLFPLSLVQRAKYVSARQRESASKALYYVGASNLV